MKLWRALICGAALAAPAPALACQCSEQPTVVGVWPADGRTTVATNARIRVLVHQAPLQVDPDLACDGVPQPLEAVRRAENGYQHLLEFEPVEDLPSGVRCELVIGTEVQSTFQTSAQPDHDSPRWSGEMDRGSIRDTTDDACGTWEKVAWIRPQDFADGSTPKDQLLFELSPTGDGPVAWGTSETLAIIAGDKCITMSSDLGPRFRLDYEVQGFDEAGNATGRHTTKAIGAGCSASGRAVDAGQGYSRFSLLLLLLTLIKLRAGRGGRQCSASMHSRYGG